jgi:adenine-specific DNA-methyltransferase
MRMIDVSQFEGVSIYQQDANKLAHEIHTDLVYLDPPYNSRQYSRFYHVYEVLVKWNKPKLKGAACKPEEENMSDYCRTKALSAFTDLVAHIDTKYIVVSYNNTYKSKSSSSENKIKLEEIEEVLKKCGDTKVFTHSHNPFNAGKTEFDDHKEYLFVTKVNNEKRSISFASILRG